MPYTTEEGGRLNNFASEPKMYTAEPATKQQKTFYVVVGALGLLLVVGLVFVAFAVSNA